MTDAPATIADVAELTAPAAAPVTPETPETPATPAAPPTMADGADTKPAAAEQAKIEAKWRDDWREALAAGDEEAMTRLRRFGSPEGVFKSWKEMERKLSSGEYKPASLPENANEADIAKYRKAIGVPDSPDGYGITPPEDFDEGEAETFKEFMAEMHSSHLPTDKMQKVAESYFKFREQEAQRAYEHAVETTTNQRAEIRAEMGRDFSRNTSLANADLVATLGEDKASGLTALTLANGTKLGDHPDFVRYATAKALASADDEMLVTSQVQSNGGKSIDAQIEDIRNLMFGSEQDRAKFHSHDVQALYNKLYQIKQSRQAA